MVPILVPLTDTGARTILEDYLTQNSMMVRYFILKAQGKMFLHSIFVKTEW
jgi:hypothetical protein